MKSDFSMASILNEKDAKEVPELTKGKVVKDPNMRIKLEDADLWRSFHCMTNEMIVTKNGRCVFCVIIDMIIF